MSKFGEFANFAVAFSARSVRSSGVIVSSERLPAEAWHLIILKPSSATAECWQTSRRSAPAERWMLAPAWIPT